MDWPTSPPEALLFDKPGDEDWTAHTHHLHLTVPGSDLWRERLAFRDALRADPALCEEYAAWKRIHATLDDEPYDTPKTPFVAQVLSGQGIPLKPDSLRLNLPHSPDPRSL